MGRRRLRSVVGIGVGLVLLALLLQHAGLAEVWGHFRAVGAWAPLLLVPYVLVTTFDTVAWRIALPDRDRGRVPFTSLYLTRMAGEAVNGLTPTATVGGEPLKAYLLRRWGVPPADGMASVVIARTALVVTQSFFTAIGVAAVLDYFDRQALALGVSVLLLVATLAFSAGLVWLQRRSPASIAWRALRRLLPRAAFVGRLERGALALDDRLAAFYDSERRAFLLASGWSLAGWLFGIVEAKLIAELIGAPIDWDEALIIEALGQPIRAAAIVIPGGLGTQEWGGAWLCTALGMPESGAVSFWLLKRVREIFFDGVGLLYLATATRERASGAPSGAH